MVLKTEFLHLIFIISFGSWRHNLVEGIVATEAEAGFVAREADAFKVVSSCYNNTNTVISGQCEDKTTFMTGSVYLGFKPASDQCDATAVEDTCCNYNETDCLQMVRKISAAQKLESGTPEVIKVNVTASLPNATCDDDNVKQEPQFVSIDYYCIPDSRIKTTCTSVDQSSDRPLYLQNRNYPDTYCPCSVEVYSLKTIEMVVMRLTSNANPNCPWNLTVSDEENNNLWNFTSTSDSIGSIDIQTITLPSTYIKFNQNMKTPDTSVCGNFTLGFQAVERGAKISVKCPAKPPTDCGRPSNVMFGNVAFSGTRYGDTATYTCIIGYNVTSGNALRTCLDTGWNGTKPNCTKVDCGPPNNVTFGNVTFSGTKYEDTATYTCNIGYNVKSGNALRTCLDTGSWNGTEPACAKVDCGSLVDIDNADVKYIETVYGSVATYTCHPGYRISGYESRTCKASGQWSDVPPTCLKKVCDTPQLPEHAVSVSLNQTFGGVERFTCEEGYQLRGADYMECLQNCSWSIIDSTCQLIDCSSPVFPESSEGVHPYKTKYRETVTFRCLDEYKLSGVDSLECLKNGSWSTPLGRCEKSATVAPWVYYGVIPAACIVTIAVVIGVILYVRNKRRSDKYKAEKAREKERALANGRV